MLAMFRHMFTIADLRGKILFTMAMFAVYRLGTAIPVPGHRSRCRADLAGPTGGRRDLRAAEPVLWWRPRAVLGALPRHPPYITATIIMQFLTVVIPRLAGNAGRGRERSQSDHPMDPLSHRGTGRGAVGGLHVLVPYRPVYQRHRSRAELHPRSRSADRPLDDGRHRFRDVARRVDHPAGNRQRHVASDLCLDPEPVPVHLRADLGHYRRRRAASVSSARSSSRFC